MAMQPAPAAAVVPNKIPLQWYNPQQQWDEKEGFLMWLRGEFAAANAIIDALCYHLRAVGEPGEYDTVVGCVEQRRCNWNSVLYMQQYFSVAEVDYALQQVGWRRQQLRGGKRGGRIGGQKGHFNGKANGGGQKDHFGAEANGNLKSGSEGSENDEKKECDEKSLADSSLTSSENAQAPVVRAEDKTETEGSCCSESALQLKKNHEITPRTFLVSEIIDGKSVNVAEGMKLYERLFSASEISKLISLVNDLRTAGRRGQLSGQTYVSKRPMKGHGREIIQLGVPVIDTPLEDELASWTSKDQKTEPIPELMLTTVESLLSDQVLTTKPDTCLIDIFNEGDHSQPYTWPQWYGRPVCRLFLTECDMTFGKVITVDHPGGYRGALTVSFSPGSVLVMQGKSADFSRHAIPSMRNQRIIVMFLKSLPKKAIDPPPRSASTPPLPPSHWAPPPIRPTNHARPKHFTPPNTRPLIPQPNAVQPIFVPSPGIAFPSPAPPRPQQPVMPALGTGVFIPPQGSGNHPNQTGDMNPDTCNRDDDCSGKSNACNGTNEHVETVATEERVGENDDSSES